MYVKGDSGVCGNVPPHCLLLAVLISAGRVFAGRAPAPPRDGNRAAAEQTAATCATTVPLPLD
jgi:hypothetical protein